MNQFSQLTDKPYEVRHIFGANLEKLMHGRYSKRKLADTIGISRSQLDRYLSGKSTPRADILARFCRLFDVDANILLRPLDLTGSASGSLLGGPDEHAEERGDFLSSLLGQPSGSQLKFRSQFQLSDEEVPLGVYRMWVTSMGYPGYVGSSLMIVKEKHGVRTWRFAPLGWEVPIEPVDAGTHRLSLTGVLLKQHLHHICLLVNQNCGSIQVWHSTGNFSFEGGKRLINGYYIWMPDNAVTQEPNAQRYLMERVVGGLPAYRKIAEEPRHIKNEDLPRYVRLYLGLDTVEYPDA